MLKHKRLSVALLCILGVVACADEHMDARVLMVDMRVSHTLCDDDPWLWVRSPDDLNHNQVRILREGVFKVVSYKNGAPSENDQWEGVVYKRVQNDRCYPVLQSWQDYRDQKHNAVDCYDPASIINVTFPRSDQVSILINCVAIGPTATYQVTRMGPRPNF